MTKITAHALFIVFALGLIILMPNESSAKSLNSQSDILVTLSKVQDDEKHIPVRISIPSIDVNLYVDYGFIENDTWSLNDSTALYAEGSSYLDDKNGNTIIYAHARDGMFRDLDKVSQGDLISIISNDAIYDYEIEVLDKVLPEDINKILSSGEYNLTLFTCDGYGDEYRLIVKAKLREKILIANEEVI